MSLPAAYQSAEEYFSEATKFFAKYQYLFSTANTEVLTKNILNYLSVENIDEREIFEEGFDLSNCCKNNNYICEFFETAAKFKVTYDEFERNSDLESKAIEFLSPKKRHEIVYLAKQIDDVCETTGCKVVVDFGSGLGYLDQLIYETTNLKVIGIECNDSHYVGAKMRQKKYHKDSVKHVKYIKHTINEHSDERIQEFVQDKYGKEIFCITGLHACADLTVDAINLFLKMVDAKALLIMPCCYHKMALHTSEGGLFKNFPLSDCLKRILMENERYEFINVPFLRLAAQPLYQYDNLEDLVFNLLARGALQVYACKRISSQVFKIMLANNAPEHNTSTPTYEQPNSRCRCSDNFKLKRNKRKAVKTKNTHNDFSIYLRDAIKGFKLISDNESSTDRNKDEFPDGFDLEELLEIWRETELLRLPAAIYVLLQNCLQPIIENFVLFDRVVYLKENGVNNSCFKKVFNEKLSPRCLALASLK